MKNQLPFFERDRTTYPGEYRPDPLISENLQKTDSFKTKNFLFSNVHVSENDEYYCIELHVPGLSREDFLVEINDRGNLYVSGAVKDAADIPTKGTDDEWSGFSRELSLPENIDTDFIKAECRYGVLSFWFLKTPKPYQKRPSLVVVY